MFTDVEQKRKRNNQILFSKESECLQELAALIRQQKRRTLVLWGLECIEKPLALLESRYPEEHRPRIAVDTCTRWAHGEIKMPEAKRTILACHAAAKEVESREDSALFHAIAQGLSIIHTEGHALGLPIYELTAIVRHCGDNYTQEVQKRIDEYISILLYYQEHIDAIDFQWAGFL